MHTLKIILGGFVLLGTSFLLGRWIGGSGGAVTALAMKGFLGLWLIVTAANMWFGVSKAGYSIKDEAPSALIVFAVPAIAAVVIWWRALST